jgi:hypothetical protein
MVASRRSYSTESPMRIAAIPGPGALAMLAGLAWLAGCRPAPPQRVLGFDTFASRTIGRQAEGQPWITDLAIADLDGDGWKDIVACDGRLNQVVWLRQTARAIFVEQDIGSQVAGPAHVEFADMNGDGRLDVLVASMGVITPSNLKTGSVVVLVNEGGGRFSNRVLLENVARVTYVAAADFNTDGRPDLVVSQFGYLQGEIRWLENRGDWQFASHALLDLPGTVHAPVADLTGDGQPDIAALVTQDTEEVHLFTGDGTGRFRDRVLWGSTNKDFGGSGLSIADLNDDGRPDLLVTNGDGFDYATPGSRPWHGVQWLENLGAGKFAFHRVGDFPGSYSPVAADLDGDGDKDLIATSGFNEWSNRSAVALMAFENQGGGGFIPRPLAHEPTHLIVVKAADLYNDGGIQLVTGAFVFYPPYERASRITLWERR